MAGFYKPFTVKVQNIPVIVYPCVGLEKVLKREKKDSIFEHLSDLYTKNPNLLITGEYHIVILWDEASDDTTAKSADVMTDVWIFDHIGSWGSGPLVDVKIFRNLQLETTIGVSAGDGLLMLGKEEERRREASNLDSYLFGTRAILPKDIQPTEKWEQ